MSWKRLIPLFVLSYVLVLVLTAPASLLRQLVTLPGAMALGPVQGSIWAGTVNWVQLDGFRVGPLHWSLNPLTLLSATPLQVELESPVSARASLGLGEEQRVKLAAAEAQATLVGLLQQLNYPNLGIDADIDLRVDSGTLQAMNCSELSGSVQLDNWRGELDGLDSVGVLSGRLSCENGRLEITVNPDNAINLSGRLIVYNNGRYQVDLRAAPPRGPLFDHFVQFLGEPRDGRSFILRTRS